jgi:hypothetical protein
MIEWKPVNGFEGYYEVSSEGNIRRIKGGSGAKLGVFLKGKTGNTGYHEVCLAKDGKHYWRLAHRLVAEAFIGPAGDLTVNHKNGDKLDNRPSNLEYMTQADNNRDCVANGRGRWATRSFDNDAVKRDEQGRFAA